MRRASWMSFGMMVTRLAWIAHKLVSSNSPTRYASEASCSAMTAEDWKRRSVLKSCAISRTSRWNGSLRISSSVLFWYRLISRRATVPGRYRCGFFTPPVAGALFLAAFVASCFLGALPPVDLRAVCFVLAMTCIREKPIHTAKFSRKSVLRCNPWQGWNLHRGLGVWQGRAGVCQNFRIFLFFFFFFFYFSLAR